MGTSLQLGVAKIDITPDSPIPLAGYAHREGAYESIIRPIYARILVFHQKDSQEKIHQALIVSADLIWWGSERVPLFKQRIGKEFGIAESSILLHGTHSHSGPQTSTCFTASLGEPCLTYLDSLEDKIFAGIGIAIGNLETVRVESQKGICELGIHRRKWVDEEIRMAPNHTGPVDPDLTVIRFQTELLKTKALLIHYTCHPTTTGDPYLSSEYSGYAMELIERHIGESSVAAFLQGCCGDIRPSLVSEGNFYRGTDDDVRRLGKTLSNHVLSLLEKSMSPHVPVLSTGQTISVPLKVQTVPTINQLQQKSKEPGIVGEWAQGLLTHPEKRKSSINLEITYLKLTNQLSILSFNSEMVVEYGLYIKDYYPGVLPIPYTNGMIGYIPTKRQIEEGGYEAIDSTLYFGIPSCFDYSIEQEIKEMIMNFIGKGHSFESSY